MDDIIDDKKMDISKVVHALKAVSSDDPIDSIIYDRITNTRDLTRGRVGNNWKARQTGMNMDHFISQV